MKTIILFAVLLFPVVISAQSPSPYNNDYNSIKNWSDKVDQKNKAEEQQKKRDLANRQPTMDRELAKPEPTVSTPAQTMAPVRAPVTESVPAGPGTGLDEIAALGLKLRKAREAK